MHVNLRQLEAFKAVMRCGSITIAAEFLNISQPSVSNLIINLERDIGFALFERRKGRVYPTSEAHQFYQVVDRGLMGLEVVAKTAEEIGDRRTGNLRIASFPAPSMKFLPHMVRKFTLSRPNLSISLVTQNSRRINEWVATGNIDLGIAQWPTEDPSINSDPIKLACVCVMPNSHRLAHREFITPQDLDNEPFITTISADVTHFRLKRAFGEAGARFRVQFESRFFAVSCALVAEGAGVSVLDPFTANDFADNGIVIREFRPEIPFEMGLLFPPHVSGLAREFAALIKSNIMPFGMPDILK